MSFDPSLPANGAQVRSDELRSQFTGLKALIDTIPVGPAGRGVADIRDNGNGTITFVLTDASEIGPFTLPTGPEGAEGRHIIAITDTGDGHAIIQMSDGTTYGPYTLASGPPGPQGFEGRGIATIRNNGDNTLSVVMTDNVEFGPFALPPGPQGPPGEVTNAQLNSAIAGTSNNSNSVATLDSSFADPDMESLRQKVNELINALRR